MGKRKRQSKAAAVSGKSTSPPGASVFSHDRAHKLRLAVLVLTVFACALSLRLFLVREILLQNSCLYADLNAAPAAGFLTPPDSDAYISLAKNFYSSYFGEQAGAMALWRTPGYPAVLIPFYSFGLAPAGILIAQAFFGAVIAVLTLLLARMLTGNTVLAGLAGLLSMISPTGVGLSGLIMNDLFMGFLVAAGVYLFYTGTVREKTSHLITAGALFSAGFLVKPILTLWPVCLIALHYLICRAEGKRPNWKGLGVAVAIPTLILGLWCSRNYFYDGVFSPSSNVNFNLHDYLRPRVEEWVKAGGLPSNQTVRRNRDEARAKLEQQTAGSSPAERLNLMKTRSMEVLRAHPSATVQVVFQNMKEHALSGWDYFPRQLPLGPGQVQKLNYAARLESVFREQTLVATAVFFLLLLIALGVRPAAGTRRAALLILVLLLIYGYFSVFSGTAFWGGSRIMYPVEFVMILLTVMMLQGVGSAARTMLAQARVIPDASWSGRGLLSRYGPWGAVLLTLGVGGYGTRMITGKDPGTLINLGNARAARGDVSGSVGYFEQAVQRGPGNRQAEFNLAVAYLKLERYAEAVPLLRDVLHAQPGDADINYFLGVALVRSDMRKDGLKYLQEALRLNPDHENAKKILSTLENSPLRAP